jgi:hypothetical protein
MQARVIRIRLIVWGIFALCFVAGIVIGWHQWYIMGPTVFVIVSGYAYYFWLLRKAKATRRTAMTAGADSEKQGRHLR